VRQSKIDSRCEIDLPRDRSRRIVCHILRIDRAVAMPDETIAISVRDHVVGFGKHTVIDHLSLDMRAGEIIGLVGASGGGKSVLMRTLIGLLPKQGGEIRFWNDQGSSRPPSSLDDEVI
jgi:ABC-type glutathione transport system ATPase component